MCQGGSASLRRHLTGWGVFSCRASFHSQEVFAPWAFLCRQDRLGIPTAESRHWQEKKWVQFGQGHMEGRRSSSSWGQDTEMLPHRA